MDKFETTRWILKGCEFIAATAAFIGWKKWSGTFWKWLLVYFVFILVAELTGMYLHNNVSHTANINFYSFLVRPVTFLFFFFIFYSYDKNKGIKPVYPVLAAVLYLLCLFLDLIYLRHQNYLIASFSFSTGTILLLVLIARFFLLFVFQYDILSLGKNMMLWFCTILFIYYLGTFPFFALRNTLAKSYKSVFEVYWFIQMSLSCLMYLLFAFSLLWAKPKL